MEEQVETRFGRADVQGYISLLDNIINRMGTNSANAKNWLTLAMKQASPAIDPEAGSTKPAEYLELMKS